MRFAWSLIFISFLAPAAAQATTSGQAYGESIQLQLLRLVGSPVNLQSGPLPLASGAVSPFSQNMSTAAVNLPLPGLGTVLQTGIIKARTNSRADGAVSSASTVNGLGLSLLTLLTLSADEVRTTAAIGGACGTGLTAQASTTLANVHLGGLAALGGGIGGNPGPNTVAVNALGIRVVLNEQVLGGDGVTTRTVSVNAIHVTIANSLLTLLGALNGDIVIGHAEASTQCAFGPPPTPPPAQADVSVTLTASPDPVTVGQPFSYTQTITNFGPSNASSTVVTNHLPSEVTLKSQSASQGVCSGSAVVICNLGTLGAGQTATIVLLVVPQVPGTLFDTAEVSSPVADVNPGDNSASVTVKVQGNPTPLTPSPTGSKAGVF